MESLIENIEKNNQFSEHELGQLTNWLYGSVALSSKDNLNQYKKKAQTLDFLIAFLKDYYEDNVWESDELEANFLDFLSKVYLQKEILQIASGEIKIKDIQSAIHSFGVKWTHPVGMR